MKEGWEIKRLKEVCLIRPPKKEALELVDKSDKVSFVPMNSLGIQQKELNNTEDREVSKVYGGYTYFKNEDVLLAKITPCFENGKLGIARNLTNGIGFGSSEFIVYRSLETLNNEYLFYYLNQESFRSTGKALMTGAVGHKRVSKEHYEDSLIPIPPLHEQKQIVTLLDQAFAAIDQAKANLEKNIQNAKELFQSKLHEIFNPSAERSRSEGWEVKCLDQLSKIINGFSFKSTSFSGENPVKSIKITNVGVMGFIEETSNNLPYEYLEEYSKVQISRDDLVLALTRTIIADGLKVAKVPKSYHGSLLNQRVAAIVANKSLIDNDYLYYYFSSQMVYNYVLSNVNTLMQPNLSISDLKKMPVPYTSIKIQKRIGRRIQELSKKTNSLVDFYQNKIICLETLKKSILQKAFAGELSPTLNKMDKAMTDAELLLAAEPQAPYGQASTSKTHSH